MENTKIEWVDHTFNPWDWGKGKPRRRTSAANWKQPLKWNDTAICNDRGSGETKSDTCAFHGLSVRRPRVFCASLADWLDDEVPIEWLADLLKLIHATPNLDWLLLTKRPENWFQRIRAVRNTPLFHLARSGPPHNDATVDLRANWIDDWFDGTPPANVWIGTTVENQEMADQRIPELLKIPARVWFLSMEPLLEAVDIRYSAFNGSDSFSGIEGIHWVIGGESGHGQNIRPMEVSWAEKAAGRLLDGREWSEFPGGDLNAKTAKSAKGEGDAKR